ncbi:endonuclease V [Candidatus Woesearchaeota archaeon]|nr:endonuclease V [Candidatus Woesearchaeota archaeon]
MDTRKYRLQQQEAAKKVVTTDDFPQTEFTAGADQAYSEGKIISAIAVLDKNLELVEAQTAVTEENFPYIPGLLYFREGPAIASAYGKLEHKPSILMIEGHGILHPLRIGIASHIGVALDIPTIGVAKQLICGEPDKNGRITYEGEARGMAIKTKEYSKPIYVSPGHRISLQTSIDIVQKSIIAPHKLPEQLHVARKIANKAASLHP